MWNANIDDPEQRFIAKLLMMQADIQDCDCEVPCSCLVIQEMRMTCDVTHIVTKNNTYKLTPCPLCHSKYLVKRSWQPPSPPYNAIKEYWLCPVCLTNSETFAHFGNMPDEPKVAELHFTNNPIIKPRTIYDPFVPSLIEGNLDGPSSTS
jgi:hypothetical protein